MPTAIQIWEIANGALNAVDDVELAAAHLEKDLESWICKNADILGTKLLIIDRQGEIAGVGRLDLLGIDESGKLTIIELKRDKTAREAVAQALDYAAWLDSETKQTIADYAQQHLNRPLAEAFF
jgi:RecB family endonuclease NucS